MKYHAYLIILFALLLQLTSYNQANAQTPLTLEEQVTGLAQSPVALVTAPNDVNRMFVVLQPGRIRILDLNTKTMLSNAFLNIVDKVNDSGGEQGLLGMAFHPNYQNNGFFYVNYTDNNGDTVIERYQVSAGNPNQADATSAALILGPINQPFTNHNGGHLQFGPDGYLYIGLGDGGSSGDPNCRAQNGQELLGKMLRIDVDGAFPFAIPADNPFVGDPNVLDEIWALGLRNPWRYSFDRMTGDLYIADVGQGNKEEIDFQAAASNGGENYGWKIMEGTNCFSTNACINPPPCNDPSLILPIHEYDHGVGCAVIGGHVYRGCEIQDLQGTYFLADHCSNLIWSFRFDGVNVTNFQDRTNEIDPGGLLSNITTFGEDLDGELYMATLGGDIYKIVANVTQPEQDLGFGKVGGNGLVPQLSVCGLLGGGTNAILRLRNAPANTFLLLFISSSLNPVDIRGGTLAAQPPIFTIALTTDAQGTFEANLPGTVSGIQLYFQFVLFDAGVSFNTGFSNTLLISWP